MAKQRSVARWLGIGVVGIGVAGGVWLLRGSSDEGAEISSGRPAPPASLQEVPATDLSRVPTPAVPGTTPTPSLEAPMRLPAPHVQIDESRRLSIDAASLPAGGPVTIGLALDEAALGEERAQLTAVIVSADDGRRLEANAVPAPGSQGGVRLDVDSSWLEPGIYMIQIRTREKNAFPVRRYVLDIKADR